MIYMCNINSWTDFFFLSIILLTDGLLILFIAEINNAYIYIDKNYCDKYFITFIYQLVLFNV